MSFLGNYTYPYLSSQPLYRLIQRSVDVEKIRSSPKQLIINSFNLTLGKVVRFYNDFPDIHSALLASSSIPVVFPPVKMDGHLFVDGGVTDNVPLKSAIESGAEKIYIVMNTRPEDLCNKKIRNNLALALRVMDAAQYDNLLADIENARRINLMDPEGKYKVVDLITIQPSSSLELNPLEFHNSYKLNRAIELGYQDTLHLLAQPNVPSIQIRTTAIQTVS
jgi:NTE family protein